jgi:predicted acylesterase/phospholipase RssA
MPEPLGTLVRPLSPRYRQAAALTSLCLALSGCASTQLLPTIDLATVRSAQAADEFVEQPDRQRHVLALSSGGADGAFGAGVLVGWSMTGKRPEFDVVSGVSTGALQAPLAFLGSRYDDLLEAIFTNTRTEDVFNGNGPGVLIKPGLNDAGPLRGMLQRILTPEMLDEIAVAHRSGRRLFVTTTDLTNGRSVTWNMGALAASGLGDARSAFIEILLASAAPPGFVEPIALYDAKTGTIAQHGDGGVKNPIVVEPAMLAGGGRTTLWVIANGHVSRVSATRFDGNSALTLARRGVSQLLRSLIYGAVQRSYRLAKDSNAAFFLQRMPNALPEAASPFVFEPTEMRALFEAGHDRGRKRNSWLHSLDEDTAH